MLKWIVLVTLLTFVGLAQASACAKVWLTVSSLWRAVANSNAIVDSELEVNWKIDCPGTPQTQVIGLFSDDPALNKNIRPQLIVSALHNPVGYYRTNISIGRSSLMEWDNKGGIVIPGAHCLNHYAALYVNDTIIASTCLKIRPTWMYSLRKQIGHLPIASLMIPGTHNSGCYYEGNLTVLDIIRQGYLLTQDRNVWNQLVHGIRYLDLRVGWYPLSSINTVSNTSNNRDDHFYINHDIIKVRPLKEVLKQIKDFLHIAKGEIVILDFHRFPVGLDGRPNRHKMLASILQREFGDIIINPDASIYRLGPTLNDIWSSGKQLIICYGDKRTANEYDFLWPSMAQAWGNKQKVSDLLQYLKTTIIDSNKSKVNNPLWALMAELTPLLWDVIFKMTGNLRQLADSVNRNLTTFFESNETYCDKSNIIATDFFLGNNIIDVAIESNIRKSNL